MVQPEHLETFERDGFVVIPDLFDVDEMDAYEQVVTAAVRTRSAGRLPPLEARSRYQQSFIQCMNLWEDFADVRPLTFDSRIGRAAAELLRVQCVRVWHDQALYKEAHGESTVPHQDHPYWPILETASVTAWIPFAGSTFASGAMGYVPGSHAIGLRKFVNIFFGEPDDILADPEIAAIEPVFVDVPKGGVAFHHGLTVHMAKPNVTDHDRAVHTVIYFPDGSTRGYPFPHFCVDRGGIEVGQPIDSDATPIAWPRPEGDFPPPPRAPFQLAPSIANTGAGPSSPDQ
jgi:ectoine hydroxylase-related dioxygenase (phytanoyl-CoA dioxygenase family)